MNVFDAIDQIAPMSTGRRSRTDSEIVDSLGGEASAALGNGESWGGRWLRDIQRFPGVVTAGRLARPATPLRVAVKTAPYIGASLIIWDNYEEDQAIWRTAVESGVEITIAWAVVPGVALLCSASVVSCVAGVAVGTGLAVYGGPVAGEFIADRVERLVFGGPG